MAARPSRPSGGTAGFLLTETLATFTISAFILLGLVSASSVLLRAVDRSIAHVQDVDDLGRTLNALSRDLSSSVPARFDGLEPQPYVFRGGPNSLFFAHREPRRDGSMETRVIALREIVAGAGTRLVRADARLPAWATSFEDLHYGVQRELATGQARLRFFYIARARAGSAEPPRLRSWTVGTLLPLAVIIEAVDATSNRLIFSTRVPIRASADIGCLAGGDPAPGEPPILATAPLPEILPGLESAAPPPPAPAPKPGTDDFCAMLSNASTSGGVP